MMDQLCKKGDDSSTRSKWRIKRFMGRSFNWKFEELGSKAQGQNRKDLKELRLSRESKSKKSWTQTPLTRLKITSEDWRLDPNFIIKIVWTVYYFSVLLSFIYHFFIAFWLRTPSGIFSSTNSIIICYFTLSYCLSSLIFLLSLPKINDISLTLLLTTFRSSMSLSFYSLSWLTILAYVSKSLFTLTNSSKMVLWLFSSSFIFGIWYFWNLESYYSSYLFLSLRDWVVVSPFKLICLN